MEGAAADVFAKGVAIAEATANTNVIPREPFDVLAKRAAPGESAEPIRMQERN